MNFTSTISSSELLNDPAVVIILITIAFVGFISVFYAYRQFVIGAKK